MAAPKDRPQIGPFALLGLFIFAWTLIPSAWKAISKTAFDEFQAPLWEISSRISDLSNYWGHQTDSKKTLIAKNRDLARIRADWNLQESRKNNWENELAKINGLRAHLQALQSQIGLDEPKPFTPVLARVTNRSLSGWWQSISLRKGARDGLRVKQGAIFYDGIAGRLSTVYSSSSELELASSPNFRIVASFRGDDRPVTFQGGGILPGGRPWGMVFDIPHDLQADEKAPLFLVTSALGGTFPSGLPIGHVLELEESGDGLFKTGRVLLPQSLAKISEVTLLLSDSKL